MIDADIKGIITAIAVIVVFHIIIKWIKDDSSCI